MDKILITGASGFIGLNLAENILKTKKFKLFLVDNLSRGKLDKNFRNLCKSKDVIFKKIDLNNCGKFNENFKFVFHLASIVGVKNVNQNPLKTLENNILSTINLIKSLKGKSKIILFSTSEVYSPLIFQKKNIFPLKEDLSMIIPQIVKERDSYFLSKILNEKIVALSNQRFIIFRPHNIYGPRMGSSHVIPELIKKMNKKKCIVYSPNHTRAFCYIDDAIKQICNISFNKKIFNEVFNVGNMKEEIKIIDLAKRIKFFLKSNCKLKKGSITLGSPYRRIPDMAKTLKKTKQKSFLNLDSGLMKTINWYTKNGR